MSPDRLGHPSVELRAFSKHGKLRHCGIGTDEVGVGKHDDAFALIIIFALGLEEGLDE